MELFVDAVCILGGVADTRQRYDKLDERRLRALQATLVGSTLQQIRCRRSGNVLRVILWTSAGVFEVTGDGLKRPPLLAWGWLATASQLRGKRISRIVFDGEDWGCQFEGGYCLLNGRSQELSVYDPGAIEKDLIQWFQRTP